MLFCDTFNGNVIKVYKKTQLSKFQRMKKLLDSVRFLNIKFYRPGHGGCVRQRRLDI